MRIRLFGQVIATCAGLILAASANASIIWTFTLPSTAAQSPPYEVIATLTLDQVGDDVKFTLDPNEANGGYTGPGAGQTEIKDVDFVYKGRALTDNLATDFGNIVGPGITDFDYQTNQNTLESGYTTEHQHIKVTFSNSPGFDITMISMWTIFNTTLADFDSFATSNSKPTPTVGVISVAPFAHPDQTPDPSNWVTGSGSVTVPEPGTLALLGLGLLGLALSRRHA